MSRIWEGGFGENGEKRLPKVAKIYFCSGGENAAAAPRVTSVVSDSHADPIDNN